MSSSDPGEYVPRNVAVWSEDDGHHVEAGRRAWAREEIDWGVWRVLESELGVLPEVAGLDVIELGCGTAYFSSWLARRGARVTGIDPTPAQLERARAFQREFGLEFPLVECGAVTPAPRTSESRL
jgi:2-polyprenyl-3-methyl-5-hydroxy-6-metoxy-1,4-benzoquinol methylase